jgi:hypothetical protein
MPLIQKMFMTPTEMDQDLTAALGGSSRIGNLKKYGIDDPKNIQAAFNTFYFQKLAEEAGYMLSSKFHNYENGGKVWFDSNGHPMEPKVASNNCSTTNAKRFPKRPPDIFVDCFDTWQLMELAALPESVLPYGQYMYLGKPCPPTGWVTVRPNKRICMEDK